jgi:hypothetical protein
MKETTMLIIVVALAVLLIMGATIGFVHAKVVCIESGCYEQSPYNTELDYRPTRPNDDVSGDGYRYHKHPKRKHYDYDTRRRYCSDVGGVRVCK